MTDKAIVVPGRLRHVLSQHFPFCAGFRTPAMTIVTAR
jgi:hypothetical protein